MLKIIKDKNIPTVQLRIDLAQALILKSNPRAIQKFEAQKILQKIVNQEVIDHEFTIIAMVNLCELLLDELHTYHQGEVLLELENLLNRLYRVSQDYKSYFFLIESLILKSKLALLQDNISESDDLLRKAELLATERNNEELIEHIHLEQEELRINLKKWEVISHSDFDLKKRMDELDIREYIKRALLTLRNF